MTPSVIAELANLSIETRAELMAEITSELTKISGKAEILKHGTIGDMKEHAAQIKRMSQGFIYRFENVLEPRAAGFSESGDLKK
jgi:hypothetical protein